MVSPGSNGKGRADENSWHASNPVYCNFLRSSHSSCFSISSFVISRHPIGPEFSDIFTLRLPPFRRARTRSMPSDRAESVNILFSISELFPLLFEPLYHVRKNNFLSLFLCFYSERDGEANNRESYIYIYVYIRTHICRPGIYVITSACRFCGRMPVPLPNFPEPR